MQILTFIDGNILATGEITIDNGIHYVVNDPYDVIAYSLSDFGSPVILEELDIDFPNGFTKWKYLYKNKEFILKKEIF